MNWVNTIFVLMIAFLAVFWEAAYGGFRHVVGAQIDLLPPLMVYASLRAGLTSVMLLAVLGGLWFDALSANPLGTSILPLFAVGFVIYSKRELILRDQMFAQLVLGCAASAAAPVLAVLVLLTLGHGPIIGWGLLWQLVVMTVGGTLATPAVFALFDWLELHFVHHHAIQSSFRPDREIRRGR